MRRPRVLLLDFDGVILETVGLKGLVFRELFAKYPEHVEKIVAYHLANGGISRFQKFRSIYKHILEKPLSTSEFNSLCNRFSKLAYRKVLNADFVPGAKEFLESTYTHTPLFIVSGTPEDEIRRIVKQRKLARYFHGVFGAPRSKSFLIRKILRQWRFSAKEAIFVGDAMSDWDAAQRTGIRFIARVTEQDIFKKVKVYKKMNDLFALRKIFQG